MPSKLKTPIPIHTDSPTFDGLEITGVYIVNHIQKENEEGFSGNIEIGDTLNLVDGEHVTDKRLSVHYMLLNGDVVMKKDSIQLDSDQLALLLAGYAGLDTAIKTAVFQAIIEGGIIPQDAVIV